MAIRKVNRKGKAQEAVIESKDQRWHCRNRITLVFGSNDVEELETYLYTDDGVDFTTVDFHQAKSKAVEEILDNCIDEYYRGHVTEIHIKLSKDQKTVTIEDNGIGMPPAKIPQVYTEFRTGSKFKDEETDEKGHLFRTLGQNGLGAAATCLTSDVFNVRVRHYNTRKEQEYRFSDGALKRSKTKAKTFSGHSGVKIELVLSKEVYKNNTIDSDLLRKRVIDLAYNNPGLIFIFNDEKYEFKKGLFELAQRVDFDSAELLGQEEIVYETKSVKGKNVKGKIDLIVATTLNKSSEERERFISFANSTPTFDGGFHHDRVRRLFVNGIKDKLERAAKKEKVTLNDNDILTGRTFVIGITMPNPRFESQTKRKLVRDVHLEKAFEQFFSKNFDKFLRKNKDYLELVLERARGRHRFQMLKEAAKKGRKQKKVRVEKLLDANERKERSKCTLFVCEGDSAIGGLRSSRNKLYQGGIALRGKPMNVAQASIKDILNNKEFSDVMASVGLTIGQEAEEKSMRYGQVVFLADSDVDGGHINTLLTNFFFQFWPNLFAEGRIQIAKAPLFEVILEGNKKTYAETPKELESLKEDPSVKIKEIQRNKGLGEMSPEAWKHVLSRDEFTKITVDDMGRAKEILSVCFGKDSTPRKALLMDEGSRVSLPKIEAVRKKSPVKKAGKKAKKKAAKKVAKKVTKKTTRKASKKTTKKSSKKTTRKKKA